jgi:hypothetical protein
MIAMIDSGVLYQAMSGKESADFPCVLSREPVEQSTPAMKLVEWDE